jgi:hypothetical protein
MSDEWVLKAEAQLKAEIAALLRKAELPDVHYVGGERTSR